MSSLATAAELGNCRGLVAAVMRSAWRSLFLSMIQRTTWRWALVGNGPPFSKARWARLRVHGAGSVHGLLRRGEPVRSCASRRGLRSAGGRFTPALRVLGPEAGDIEFQQDRVMHQPIDRRGGRHLIAEDPIPVREDQIAGDEDGASLVAFGQEREENLGLLGTLLDVPDVVEDAARRSDRASVRRAAARDCASPPRAPARGCRSA